MKYMVRATKENGKEVKFITNFKNDAICAYANAIIKIARGESTIRKVKLEVEGLVLGEQCIIAEYNSKFTYEED